jgi:hypothetical protein
MPPTLANKRQPLFVSTTANCFAALAFQFTTRFKLGPPVHWASHGSDPQLLKRYGQPTMAVKFANRPSFYRVTWNPPAMQYELYWLSTRD